MGSDSPCLQCKRTDNLLSSRYSVLGWCIDNPEWHHDINKFKPS